MKTLKSVPEYILWTLVVIIVVAGLAGGIAYIVDIFY